MIDEVHYQTCIEARSADPAARLLLGEALAEVGNWRAAGYRWMGQRAKLATHEWAVWWVVLHGEHSPNYGPDVQHYLPLEIWRRLRKERSRGNGTGPTDYKLYANRREAEEALCRVIASMVRR